MCSNTSKATTRSRLRGQGRLRASARTTGCPAPRRPRASACTPAPPAASRAPAGAGGLPPPAARVRAPGRAPSARRGAARPRRSTGPARRAARGTQGCPRARPACGSRSPPRRHLARGRAPRAAASKVRAGRQPGRWGRGEAYGFDYVDGAVGGDHPPRPAGDHAPRGRAARRSWRRSTATRRACIPWTGHYRAATERTRAQTTPPTAAEGGRGGTGSGGQSGCCRARPGRRGVGDRVRDPCGGLGVRLDDRVATPIFTPRCWTPPATLLLVDRAARRSASRSAACPPASFLRCHES